GIRRSALRNFFYGASRRKGSAEAEGLLLETLQGRYGLPAAEDQVRDPLLPWFTPENAEKFARALRQTAAQFGDPHQREVVAGQLGLLHLLQHSATALDALRQLQAGESDAAARLRMAEVLQA